MAEAALATLSMYDWPETASALDRLWAEIARNLEQNGISAPDHLTRSKHSYQLWRSPNLLIGQTCGWPYISQLKDTVVPFARFVYDLDCQPGDYYSVFIGRSEADRNYVRSPDGLRIVPKVAINGEDSQSGFRVYRDIAEGGGDLIAPENRLHSGSHRQSVRCVASGEANLAAIDAVAFELAREHEPDAVKGVTILGKSHAVPGLPLITSPANTAKSEALLAAVKDAVRQISETDRSTLKINDVISASGSDYEVLR